ncbi:hypothetical protein L1987_37999 [Smallanthus sonchifolius]|uniref:Uncharacterized protein n=1 Tax=Smallanthus sonchifolius TaxID=185202 RepID=A0ACB9HIA2_9ASTR|nr:hypothetical protein L1987_37999 [Smallanthus sonchifolius]
MSFSDFSFEDKSYGDPRMFPGHEEVLKFLQAFANEFGVSEVIRFNSEVVRVDSRDGEFLVEWRTMEVGLTEEVFDAVVVCNGHYTEPRVANDVPAPYHHFLISLLFHEINSSILSFVSSQSQYALPDHNFINCGSNSDIDFTGFIGDDSRTTFSLSGGSTAANNNPASITPKIYRTTRVFTQKSYDLEEKQHFRDDTPSFFPILF